MENRLEELEVSRIATILENTNVGSYNLIELMIDMSLLGIKATAKDTKWTYRQKYLLPQLESILTHPKSNLPVYSKFLENKILKFEEQILAPWFIKVFKVATDVITKTLIEWDLEECIDYEHSKSYLLEAIVNRFEEQQLELAMYGVIDGYDGTN